ncbi:hypothetical protein JYU09_01225 [bacterium AH-315-O15]|nr:hypothetical protein [bacterium AH-315-O15]
MLNPLNIPVKGVTEAYVLIESSNLDDFSTSCGITETGLTTAASKALLDNGIRVTGETDLGPILYVSVNTLYFEASDLCVSQVAVELYEPIFATPSHSAQPVYGHFELAAETGLNSSVSAEHGQRIRDTIFEYVEQIAVAIRLANQQRPHPVTPLNCTVPPHSGTPDPSLIRPAIRE